MEINSYSQIGQDLWVLHTLNYKRKGYFVEIGAIDGIKFSNTYLLEKEFGWRGIVVEPNPVYKKEIRKNRKCSVDYRAIDNVKKANRKFVSMPGETSGLSCLFDHKDKDIHKMDRDLYGEIVTVESTSPNTLLSTHKAPAHIDYMSLDTEGNELDILKILDWKRYTIQLISIEHNRNDIYWRNILDFLTGKGYSLYTEKDTYFDSWYYLNKT